MAAQDAARVRAGLRVLKRHYGTGMAAANAIGTWGVTFNAILRGDRGPSRDLAEKVAKGLGMSLATLLTFKVRGVDMLGWNGECWTSGGRETAEGAAS